MTTDALSLHIALREQLLHLRERFLNGVKALLEADGRKKSSMQNSEVIATASCDVRADYARLHERHLWSTPDGVITCALTSHGDDDHRVVIYCSREELWSAGFTNVDAATEEADIARHQFLETN
jgi:hypothetical protein